MHTGMNGHSRLYVLSGSKLLAGKALRTGLKGNSPSAQVWAPKQEDVHMTNAPNGTFVEANAAHQAERAGRVEKPVLRLLGAAFRFLFPPSRRLLLRGVAATGFPLTA